MNIIGVDFSGARSDHNTWVTRGVLDSGSLILDGCGPVTRSQLTALLSAADSATVVALDFPFAVPREFARFWRPEARTMPELWSGAAAMDLEQFLALRNEFVPLHGEPKRLADTYFPECYSCLHLANPNMVPMTFRGMQMLHQLWPLGWHVPPLPPPEKTCGVLLEAMPGAALRALGLPYKGYKNGKKAPQLRQAILDGLADRSLVDIRGLRRYLEQCLTRHDCLDSVVAAVTAALWARDPGPFLCPSPAGSPHFDQRVMLEGWLYAPVFLRQVQATGGGSG